MSKGMARMDISLFVALLVMLGAGLVLVYSSSFALAEQRFGGSEFFFARQMFRALLALGLFMIFVNVDYHVWGRLSKLSYVIVIFLLLVVLLLPGSKEINGAKRWLSIGPLTFQVSDLARMALVLFVARKCEEAGNEIRRFSFFSRMIGMISLVCLLVMLEPGISTASIMLMVSLTMLYMAGTRVAHLGLIVAGAFGAGIVAINTMSHAKLRWIEFISRFGSEEKYGYQVYQSIIGLGNGGIFGVGLGQGEQKFFYLPEPHTDFVLSILGEEIGFVGLMIIMAVYAFIVFRGMRIALKAPDKMGQLMAFGFTFAIGVNMLLNCGVATGLLPTTGVSLPFISYGGMSLVFMVCSMGIVLNISSQSNHGLVREQTIRKNRVVFSGRERMA